jgi:hypothetical protein
MLSTWYWKSIDLHFSLYFNLTACPVKWNAPKRLFIYDLKRYRDYIPWFIITFVFYGGIAYNSIILVLIRQWFSPRDNITALHITMYSLFAFVGTVPFAMAFAIIFAGEDTVACANDLIMAKAELKQLTDEKEIKKRASKARNPVHEFWLQFNVADILDYFAYCTVIGCAVFPFVFAILPYFLNLNPFIFLLEDVLPPQILQDPSIRIPIEIISGIIFFLSVAEGFRLFLFINLFVILTSILWLHVISLMEVYFEKRILNKSHSARSSISNRRKLYLIHTKMTIVNTVVLRFGAPEGFVLTNIGKIVLVFLVFMTIRMHTVLPIEIYIFIPVATFGLTIVTIIVGFTAAEVNEQSSQTLKGWEVHGARSKLIKKMFSSLRPFTMASGLGGFIFYHLTRSFFTELMEAYLMECIDWLIFIPSSVIEEMKFGQN